jgi:thioredoxin 1
MHSAATKASSPKNLTTTCSNPDIGSYDMKFWLLTSMFMLTAVGYASVVAPCQKTVPLDLSGHIARAVPVAKVDRSYCSSDYCLFAGPEGATEPPKNGTTAGPSEPAAGPAAPVKAPEVSPGTGKDQAGKDSGNQTPADPTKNYLIYFTATWCGPCQSQKPIIEQIKATGKHKVHIVDIDNDPKAASSWGVTIVPTVAVVREGKVVYRGTGAGHSREFLESKLEGK